MAALPSYADKQLLNFTERFASALDRFTPDQGPDIVFRKFTGTTAEWDYRLVLSETEVGTLLTFWNDTAGAGTVTFTATHPRRNETRNVRFLTEPQAIFLGGTAWEVTFVLLVLPQGGAL